MSRSWDIWIVRANYWHLDLGQRCLIQKDSWSWTPTKRFDLQRNDKSFQGDALKFFTSTFTSILIHYIYFCLDFKLHFLCKDHIIYFFWSEWVDIRNASVTKTRGPYSPRGSRMSRGSHYCEWGLGSWGKRGKLDSWIYQLDWVGHITLFGVAYQSLEKCFSLFCFSQASQESVYFFGMLTNSLTLSEILVTPLFRMEALGGGGGAGRTKNSVSWFLPTPLTHIEKIGDCRQLYSISGRTMTASPKWRYLRL